ncbi:MAG: baseplate J/gp47 family protein [Clostridia bacterium]
MAEYTPPAMLSDIDDEVIHARMMANLPADIDKTKGGFAFEFTRPAAIAAANMMIDLNEAIQMFFPAYSYGIWLDQLAQSAGISRRAATRSTGLLSITGTQGTIIPIGFTFATPSSGGNPNVEFDSTSAAEIPATGTITVPVRCVSEGTIGNVPANCITLMSTPISGIASVVNENAFTGGMEEEDDETFVHRINKAEWELDASFVGSPADYERWALEVAGVGSVIVVPEWKGVGTGSVKLIILDANGQPAGQDILTAVYDHVISPDRPSDRKAPIGAMITVVSATSATINLSARVELAPDTALSAVSSDFKAAIAAYFSEASGTVRYTKIGSLLGSVSGVLDYDLLRVNNGTANIQLGTDQIPVVGAVTLEVIP